MRFHFRADAFALMSLFSSSLFYFLPPLRFRYACYGFRFATPFMPILSSIRFHFTLLVISSFHATCCHYFVDMLQLPLLPLRRFHADDAIRCRHHNMPPCRFDFTLIFADAMMLPFFAAESWRH